MIKGINRNVIEIVETDSELFERAILFVRPEGAEKKPAYLESSARSFLASKKMRRKMLRKKAALGVVIGYILAAGMGAVLTALLLHFL